MNDANERTRTIEALHRQYGGVIYDLCVRILKDSHGAEDAVQETFINAYRALSSFTYGDNHLPWLYRIATNVCLKNIRAWKRKGMVLMDDLAAKTASREMDPLSAMHARNTLETLVETLDTRSQEILVSHYIAGMDQGEIAECLGISRRAVVKRLTKLRNKAKQLWSEVEHE